MANDHHGFDNSVHHPDDCECVCRTNPGWEWISEEFTFRAPDLSTGARTGKYLRRAADLNRAGVVLHQDAPTRWRTTRPLWAQIEEGENKQSAWQQRMRTRLSLHTPTSQKTTGGTEDYGS